MNNKHFANVFHELNVRGLVYQRTIPDRQLVDLLNNPTGVYVGFDPTSDSLHVGSLLPIMATYWFRKYGHKTHVILGTATALIGDPSGKTEARKMLSELEIDDNCEFICNQLAEIWNRVGQDDDFATIPIRNNWIKGISWVEMLRTVGIHFSINHMLTMDSVKSRLENGLSFLEFNYMIMQAYDFLYMNKHHDCKLQFGGQDQWGNIIMGLDLLKQSSIHDCAGLTIPLLTKANGSKFGKSENGNVWLDKNKTPIFDFYQFWRNVPDADVGKFLKMFTILSLDDIQNVLKENINEQKKVLAFQVTKFVHGTAAACVVRDEVSNAFGASKNVHGDSIPHGPIEKEKLTDKISLLDLLVQTTFVQSKNEARRLVLGNGVKINDVVCNEANRKIGLEDVQNGIVTLHVGKKKIFRYDVT